MKFIVLFLYFFVSFLFAAPPEALENSLFQIEVSDSSKNSFLKLKGVLYDSLTVTKIKGRNANNVRHIDNEAIVSLQFLGALTDKFHFQGDVRVANDKTNRDFIYPHSYEPYEGYPYNKQSNSTRTWDDFRLSLDYKLPFVKLYAGIDYLQIGTAKRNNVILRGDKNIYRPWQDSSYLLNRPAPTPYFGYEFKIGPLTYSQYVAKLYHRKNLNKYMHTHRLEAKLPWNITLGLSEIVLYGTTVENDSLNINPDADSTGRTFEWSYVIPFIPYAFEEHFHGDKDNNALALDFRVKTLRHFEFYGEFYIDDMKSPTDIFDDSWWGNKWAATLGVETNHNIRDFLFTWNLEYTRIEPWVYTHHKGAGYTYTNYAQSLGSDLGPNAKEIYASLSVFWKIFDLKLFVSNVFKDTAFSSDIFDIHTPLDRTDKTYLKDATTFQYLETGFELTVFPADWFYMHVFISEYFADYKGYRLGASGGIAF